MKTVIKEQQQSTKWKFPCLAKGKGGLVIAARGQDDDDSIEGTVVIPNDVHDLFYHSTSFQKDFFTPIPTPVTIEFIPD